jgi:hypothetical protein
MKKKDLPYWFYGFVYKVGGKIQNPHSKEVMFLDAHLMSMYDFIRGCELLNEYTHYHNALEWIKSNYIREYYFLLEYLLHTQLLKRKEASSARDVQRNYFLSKYFNI